MPHNRREINADELYALLESISKYIDREVDLYALGGTALTILGIKRSTMDIDINIESADDHGYICRIFSDLGFENQGNRWFTQEGLAFDLFYGSNLLGTDLLPDCTEKSRFIRRFGRINLYTLHLYDIIISKLARGDPRDFEDIRSIFENEKIDLEELVSRYQQTMESSVVKDARQKLLDMIELKFRDWGIIIDKRIIEDVKKWNLQ
jgi:hypothetical protein